MTPETKRCGGPCQLEKPLEQFARSAKKTKGRQSTCRLCRAQYDRKYYERNRSARIEMNRTWKDGNRAKVNEASRRRKMRLAALPGGPFDPYRQDYQAKLLEQQRLCAYCQEPRVPLSPDHVLPCYHPASSNAPDNIAWACQDCQGSKLDRTVEEWVEYLKAARPDHAFLWRKT